VFESAWSSLSSISSACAWIACGREVLNSMICTNPAMARLHLWMIPATSTRHSLPTNRQTGVPDELVIAGIAGIAGSLPS